MTTALPESGFHKQVRNAAGLVFWFGVALVVVGVASLVFPVISTLVATFFVGWILVMAGLVTIGGAFSIRGTGPFFGAFLFGVLALGAGVFMLVRPVAGELAITAMLGFLFMLQGASEAFLAFELRPLRSWGWMLVSATASILMAIIIIAGLPGVSLIALGVIIGVNFLTSGVGYILVSRSVGRQL